MVAEPALFPCADCGALIMVPLMGYLGLIPSEDSSGERRQQGAITKAGNSFARRALVEAAWAYQFSAKVSALIARRQVDVPKAALDIAWRAQVRLCARFRRLAAPWDPPQQDRGGNRARAGRLCVGHCATRQARLIEATRIDTERRQRTSSLDPSAR